MTAKSIFFSSPDLKKITLEVTSTDGKPLHTKDIIGSLAQGILEISGTEVFDRVDALEEKKAHGEKNRPN